MERIGGRSVATEVYATSPLRLLTPASHGRAAWIFTSSYGGGLVDGDAIDLQILVRRGADAFLSTQASTKVYRSPAGTSASVRARVESGALLVMAPDPVVCFAGSTYRQRQQIDVEGDGAVVLVDVLSSGRRARGERWAFDEYRSVTDVRLDGRTLVHDALALRAADGPLAARLGRFDVLAWIAIVGRSLEAEWTGVRAAISEYRVTRQSGQIVVAAPLGDAGCLVRVAGTSVEEVGHTIRALLHFVPERLGDNPWRRKW